MTEQPRDWDKEMAEIDRLMTHAPAPAKGPGPASAPAAPPARRPAASAAPVSPSRSRHDVFGTWARAVAGAVLAGAMTQWPYAHGCGGGLMLYTGAAAAVVLTGAWGASAAWRNRIAAAHVLALVVMGWGFGLLATIILPRIGYAAQTLTWFCP